MENRAINFLLSEVTTKDVLSTSLLQSEISKLLHLVQGRESLHFVLAFLHCKQEFSGRFLCANLRAFCKLLVLTE
jgi:hypothetical protein